MAQVDDKATGGMKPWLRVLLVASLALNLLIVGGFVGAMAMRGTGHAHHPPRLDSPGGPLTRALSREDRRAIGQEMRKAYGMKRKHRAEQRAGLESLVADLKATPFNPDAVAIRMAQQRDQFGARLELGQKLLLERLTQMTEAERVAYADRLQDGIGRHWSRKDRAAGD